MQWTRAAEHYHIQDKPPNAFQSPLLKWDCCILVLGAAFGHRWLSFLRINDPSYLGRLSAVVRSCHIVLYILVVRVIILFRCGNWSPCRLLAVLVGTLLCLFAIKLLVCFGCSTNLPLWSSFNLGQTSNFVSTKVILPLLSWSQS